MIIILDTNVLSELMRPQPAEQVVRWFKSQEQPALHVTVITLAEILSGIESLPAGKRRSSLLSASEQMFVRVCSGRVLPFDEPAARLHASIVTARSRLGRPIPVLDAMIAAIAKANGAALATRNTRDFQHCGLRLFDPWA